jgi:cytochrome c peroxidase
LTRRYWTSVAAVLAAALVMGCGATPAVKKNATPSAAVLAGWRADVDSLAAAVAVLEARAASTGILADTASLRAAFREARRRFKLAEVALEYYAPSTSRSINGPPVPDVEEPEGPEVVIAPSGFQVIEGLLYGDAPVPSRAPLLNEVGTLRAHVTRARTMLGAQETTDAHVWDAARLEISRVLTLGIAGFDAGASGDALPEARAALAGVARTLAPYAGRDADWARLREAFSLAQSELDRREADGSFNALAFIAQRGVPLARALVAARQARRINTPAERRAFRMTAASVFEADAIDPDGFALLGLDRAPPERVALGRALFADGRLSASGARSCASCHVPGLAFTDGQPRARGLSGAALARNTPTVINSGLQVGQFADLRTTYLEDQVTEVVRNAEEMHGNLEQASRLLRRDSAMVTQFALAFPGSTTRDSVVTPWRIRYAVAAYVRSLSRLNAPVDRALRGDTLALSADARAGLNVFVGKARCASCHFLPLTNGTVPPMYQRSEMEVLGVPERDLARGARIDADPGRYALSRSAPHRYAFRTPSLRNVALTAPYMHNGAFATLEAVITFYDRGGGAGVGIALPNQTLPATALRLTPRERTQLVRFLEALTDTTGLR